MTTELKTKLFKYFSQINNPTEEEKSILNELKTEEMDYVDIPYMCICHEDIKNVNNGDLEKIAEVMGDLLQEDFSYYLSNAILELNYQ